MILASAPGQLSLLEAAFDRLGRAVLPFLTPQILIIAALVMICVFWLLRLKRDRVVSKTEELLRVGLTTITLLSSVVAIFGLILPTPPAPPELSPVTLRLFGMASGVALFSYAIETLIRLFKNPLPPPLEPPSPPLARRPKPPSRPAPVVKRRKRAARGGGS